MGQFERFGLKSGVLLNLGVLWKIPNQNQFLPLYMVISESEDER